MSLRSRRSMKRMKSTESEVNPSSPATTDEINIGTYRKRTRQTSKKPCLNRNALMARANRQRKKAYLEKLENKLSFYQQENQELSRTVEKQASAIKQLTTEVTYLKNIVNNSSGITTLLKALNHSLRMLSNDRKKRTGVNDCVNINVSGQSSGLRGNLKDDTYYNSHKNSIVKNVAYSFPNLDHTYMSTNPREIENTKELIISDPICQATIDNCTDSKETSPESLSSARSDNICDMELAAKDNLSSGLDLDQLPPFNVDFFEDLPKYDEGVASIDNLQDAPNFFKEEDIFQNLNDAGICLHVNSDKVSLEYCPNCQLNNMNSGID